MKLRLFGDLETIGTVPPSFKGCSGFWACRDLCLQIWLISSTKDAKRIHFIQNVSR